MSAPPPDPAVFPGSRWQVQFLGGLLLRLGDIEIRRLSRQAATLLFARLAMQPRTAQGRDELAQALWPEIRAGGGHPAGDAAELRRSRLRRVLSELRGVLEPPGFPPGRALVADRDTVRLNAAAFDIDAVHFERHAARRQWLAARSTYRGDFLPGLHDPWAEEQRQRLAALRQRVDEALAEPMAWPDGPEAEDVEDDDDEHGGGPAPGRDGRSAAGGNGPPGAGEMRDAREARDARDLAELSDDGPAGPVVPYVTAFFGRLAEIETLRQAVMAHRLVSVTGPVGAGKTRLVTEAARELAGFDPVVMVALAACPDAAQIVEHLRAALGLRPAARPPLDQIAARLAGRRALLLLDNFEQLAGPAGLAVLASLRDRLPAAHLLVTSSVALAIDDLHGLALQPLPTPAADADLGAAARNPGVALFVDRARAARADFGLHARNVRAVVQVCRQLEGLPLAIELVAAKIRSHRPQQMLAALQARQPLLARPPSQAARHGRHASLEAALGWSWSLLGEPEREALCALSVFRSGWTLAQAGAVLVPFAVEPVLARLAAHSLVRAAPEAAAAPGSRGAPRLDMLAAVREFAAEKLQPAQLAALRSRHRACFLALAQDHAASAEWASDADLPNLVEALRTACQDGEPECAASLALALDAQWRASGAPEEVLGLLSSLTQGPGLSTPRRCALLCLQAALQLNALRPREAQACLAQAAGLAGDDPALRAEVLLLQGSLHWRSSRDGPRALDAVAQAMAFAADLPASEAAIRLRARALLLEGAITLEVQQRAVEAARMFEQSERLFGHARDRRASVLALPGRAACLLAQGQHAEVIRMATAGARRAAELGDHVTRLQLLDRLAIACEAVGRLDEALVASRQQARLASSQGLDYFVAFALWNQCQPLAALQRPREAARLLAFARRYWVEQLGELGSDDEAYIDTVRVMACRQISDTEWRAQWARGEAMALPEGLALGCGQDSDPASLPRREPAAGRW